MKDLIELNEKEYIVCPNLWDTMKSVLTSKFITFSAFINKNCGYLILAT